MLIQKETAGSVEPTVFCLQRLAAVETLVEALRKETELKLEGKSIGF